MSNGKNEYSDEPAEFDGVDANELSGFDFFGSDEEPMKDITTQQAAVPAFSEDATSRATRPQYPQFEADWPATDEARTEYSKPFRPYEYQEAESNLPAEDQEMIEPVVFDTEESAYIMPTPQSSITDKFPTEKQAHIPGQAPPIHSPVFVKEWESENKAASKRAKKKPGLKRTEASPVSGYGKNALYAMESAMAGYFGISGYDPIECRRAQMSGVGANFISKAFDKVKKEYSKAVEKNKVMKVIHAFGIAPLRPDQAVEHLAKAFGGKDVQKWLKTPDKIIQNELKNKKAKDSEKKRQKAIAKAAEDKKNEMEKAKQAAIDKKKAEEILKDVTFNYKDIEKFVKNSDGTVQKTFVKTKESANIFIPEVGNVTIPFQMFTQTPPLQLYEVAIQWKTAQAATQDLESQAKGAEQLSADIALETQVKQDELAALQNSLYAQESPISRTPEQIVQDNAQYAMYAMQNNNIPPTQDNINAVAQVTSQQYVQNTQSQIYTNQLMLQQLEQERINAAQAAQQMQYYIQSQGGTPYPTQPPPQQYPSEVPFEQAWSDTAESERIPSGGESESYYSDEYNQQQQQQQYQQYQQQQQQYQQQQQEEEYGYGEEF